MRFTRPAFYLALILLALASWNLAQELSFLLWPAPAPTAPPRPTRVYEDPERIRVAGLLWKIRRETELLQTDGEAEQIFMSAARTSKIQGDLAEVGVYKGGSAKLICEAKGDRPLHLFDTFEGVPKVESVDRGVYRGQFPASLEAVREYLRDCKRVYFYKGWFPATARPIEEKRFSFVHLDMDTYEGTTSGLRFFYPRMARGGIMLLHDYVWLPGVRKAVDEFFEDKPEAVVELSDTQCLIVKL